MRVSFFFARLRNSWPQRAKNLPQRAVEKIPQGKADSLCIFQKLSAVRRRKVARATSCLEISRSSVGVLGE